ncbi:coiled-coil domain-containing protein 150 isoform X1 [Chiloscyllium plagiosum]|uniref:coiled-coil domain-containing protein 150 isoform X1 n=3 Tax=Chiloscyllium plagiosum TaxID=36176 RepID=UPI001CB7F0A7|nr:coiled-coil domain-containing protein 150 isoform X1 [Chiloscyllium plagiosum]XP_043558128.1 coiled-coil domain-containing protein 150 isoform X1 [Chiloscyllium plagiosum]
MTTDTGNMSRLPIPPIHVGATAPESFTVLQHRIIAAEEQTEALIQQLDDLGFGVEDTEASKIGEFNSHRPVSPFHVRKAFGTENDVLWKNYESLVSRVCRLESIIQTMKLNVFRVQTAKELNSENSVNRLAAMEAEHVQELKKMQWEIMHFRQQLSEVSEEKEAAQEEIERLSTALEMATASKTDVAVAAEELRVKKGRISRRLQEMQKELVQEESLRKALEESHTHLLKRIQDMENAVEVERTQVKVLHQDIVTLRNDGEKTMERLQLEQQKTSDLEKMNKQLRMESDTKESIISQMADEGKKIRQMLSKQQEEKLKLQSEILSLKEVAEKVQALNDQLNTQCTELSGALRSISMENAKLIAEHEASLKAEQEKMKAKLQEQDLLLDAARAAISAELQSAVNEKQQLKTELGVLRLEHTEIKQKFETVEEKATVQKLLFESAIAQLKEDLKATVKECECIKQGKETLLDQTNKTIDKITGEKNKFEKQLTEKQLELSALTAALEKQEKEKEQLLKQLAALEHQQHAQEQIEHALAEITESKNKLAYDKGRLQARVEQLQEELQCMSDVNSANVHLRKFNTVLETKYTQAQLLMKQKEEDFAMAIKSRDEAFQEIQKLRKYIEVMEVRETHKIVKLQESLTDSKQDNSQMTVTLENVLASHIKLQQTVENLQVGLGQREPEISYLQRDKGQEFKDAKIESKMFTERIEALKKQFQSEREIEMKASQKEIMELKKCLSDATSKTAEVSRANRELRLKVSEFEKTIKSQKTKIKDQKIQLKHHLETRTTYAQNTERMKELEADLKQMEGIKELYQKKNYEQSQMIQKFVTEMQSLQEELQNVAKSQLESASLHKQQEFQLKKEHKLSQELRSKCQTLEAKVRSLQICKEVTEQKLKEAGLESQQVSANLEEAHQWFKSKFDSLQIELLKMREMDLSKEELCDRDNLMKTGTEMFSRSRQRAKDMKVTTFKIPSPSSLSRWETKQELKFLSRKYSADMPK